MNIDSSPLHQAPKKDPPADSHAIIVDYLTKKNLLQTLQIYQTEILAQERN